uniref:Uncharacterized protein n=1 Tax=Rhizophora mucronata TaxID=61149 RepID=A0A2P2MMW2_RHIMU
MQGRICTFTRSFSYNIIEEYLQCNHTRQINQCCHHWDDKSNKTFTTTSSPMGNKSIGKHT